MTDGNAREVVLTEAETADVGRELLPGVRLLEVGLERGRPIRPIGPRRRFAAPAALYVVLRYEVHGWEARLRSGSLYGPVNAPVSLTVEPAGAILTSPGRDQGITTEALRGIPMADARRRIKAISRRVLEQSTDPWYLQTRLTTDRDWASFARAYAEVVERGERSPVVHLAKVLGISHHTVSARVRLARDKGLLTRPTSESLGQLTEKAQRILEAQED